MKRYLCAYLPALPFDLIRKGFRKSDSTTGEIFLTSKIGNQLLVYRATDGAKALGVRERMPLALAQALVPHAALHAFEPLGDCDALTRLARWAVKFAPFVGFDPEIRSFLRSKSIDNAPDPIHYGLILNITGTSTYHRGETLAATKMIQDLARHGIRARVGTASTIAAAWALSRFGPDSVNIAHDLSPVMKLPLPALRIHTEAVEGLRTLGITTVEQLLALPAHTLLTRFGPAVITRLDQLSGAADEPFEAIELPPEIIVRRSFDIPITRHEVIVSACLTAFEETLAKLAAKKRRARSYLLELESLNMDRSVTKLRREVSLYASSRNLAHLRSILEPLLESIRTQEGIRALTVFANQTERAHESQHDFIRKEELDRKEAGGELMNSLVNRLGKNRVLRMELVNSHVPERSFSFRSATDRTNAAPRPVPRSLGEGGSSSDSKERSGGRPPLMLGRPESIAVVSMLPDKPPSRIIWGDTALKILRGVGPESISAEWWRAHITESEQALRTREYFRIQDEHGRWLWVFRNTKTMEWFVHGVWS